MEKPGYQISEAVGSGPVIDCYTNMRNDELQSKIVRSKKSPCFFRLNLLQ